MKNYRYTRSTKSFIFFLLLNIAISKNSLPVGLYSVVEIDYIFSPSDIVHDVIPFHIRLV